jgi:hypothetical protein
MISENAVSDFIGVLGERAPNIETIVDAPADPKGETFIDVKAGSFSTEVSYRPAFGFGIYIKNGTFGQRPDEVFRHADKAVTRVLQLRDAFEREGTIGQLTLAEMQILVGPTQDQIAETESYFKQIVTLLEKVQQLIQEMEKIQKRTDKQVSVEEDLRAEIFVSRIRAMGGRLEMNVVFDDMEARLELPLELNK